MSEVFRCFGHAGVAAAAGGGDRHQRDGRAVGGRPDRARLAGGTRAEAGADHRLPLPHRLPPCSRQLRGRPHLRRCAPFLPPRRSNLPCQNAQPEQSFSVMPRSPFETMLAKGSLVA